MPDPSRVPNLASLITPLIKRGIGPREGARLILGLGVPVERGVLLSTWGEVARGLSSRTAVSLAPLSRRPGPDERTVWGTNRQRGYLYQLEMQVQIANTDVVATRLHSVRTNTLITYGDAIDEAFNFLTDTVEQYGETVLGGMMVGVYEMRPKPKNLPLLDRLAVEQFGEAARATDIPLFGGGVAVRGEGGRFVGRLET